MAKVYLQASPCPWGSSASLAANGSISGSFRTDGYAELTGIFLCSASLKAASGIRIEQSGDLGSNWDYATDYANGAANTGSIFSISLYGNAAKVTIRNGADDAATFRTAWRLRPI